MSVPDQQSTFDLPSKALERPEFTDKTLFHVGVSGGKDSGAALLFIARESGIDAAKIRASFCDIGNDHEWTIQHVKTLSDMVHPIETIYPDFCDVKDGLSGKMGFFDLAFYKHRFPSTKVRFCTEYLKIFTTQRHILKLRYEGWNVIAVSGVRADESDDRALLPEWSYSGNLFVWEWRPLIKWQLADVFAIHKRHGIPLNPLYGIGAQRVGCWPCFMSRKEEIRTIALKFPERIDQIREQEQKFEKEYGRYSSFFAMDKVPLRFRSKAYVNSDGETIMVPTIDDVVRWSLTGDGAKGSWEDDEPKEPKGCNSGYCE